MSDAQGWEVVCREFDALRRDAGSCGLGVQYRALEGEAGRDPARLPDWLELRRQIADWRRHEERYGKLPSDDVEAELRAYGIFDWSPVTYVCPAQRCTREESALTREVPMCKVFGQPMKR